jgi:hypothetical protein
MSHGITELDKGYVHGKTWHGRPEYIQVPDEQEITTANIGECWDFPIEVVPTFTDAEHGSVNTGGFAAIRMDTNPPHVLAPNLGGRFTVMPRMRMLSVISENLLAEFPQLKIAGGGTLDSGAGAWLQFVAERYGVKGDDSDHELRLCYAENLGKTTHEVFCSHIRIECQNTLRAAWGDALARGMFAKHRHTRGAEAKIHATADLFAELHLGLERERADFDLLAATPLTGEKKAKFLDLVLPIPPEKDENGKEASSTRARNAAIKAREDWEIVFAEQRNSMTLATSDSLYGALQAYTNWSDHKSYSRNPFDRAEDALYGKRSLLKVSAKEAALSLVG